MNAPTVDIKTILAGESSLALTYATDLFIGETPGTAQDNAVCLFDTGGFEGDLILSADGDSYDKPTVQVRVRGAKGDYTGAMDQARDIKDVLHGYANQAVGGATYLGIFAQGDVMFVGWDDNHRPMVTVNFRIDRTTE